MSERFAIYYTPPAADPLTRLAAAWLGRDAFTGRPLPQPETADLAAGRMMALTALPRRYGFHATLKAPFRLAAGTGVSELAEELYHFAATTAPFELPPLRIERIGSFFALVLSRPSPDLQDTADALVAGLDRFRAPPTPAETSRRHPQRLSASERANLERWGYPYVGSDFRFHMTLTGPVPEDERLGFGKALDAHFAAVRERAAVLDHIALFRQPMADGPFHVERMFPLAGAVAASTSLSTGTGHAV